MEDQLRALGVTDADGGAPLADAQARLFSMYAKAGGDRRTGAYLELLKPEGPIVFAGEHLSYIGLWQEGAALSAHEALKLIQAMAAEKPAKAAA